jgi:hypothetical protein
MKKNTKKEQNNELKQLGTHAFAATNLHQTRNTAQQSIEAPAVLNPGPYDTRTGNYE